MNLQRVIQPEERYLLVFEEKMRHLNGEYLLVDSVEDEKTRTDHFYLSYDMYSRIRDNCLVEVQNWHNDNGLLVRIDRTTLEPFLFHHLPSYMSTCVRVKVEEVEQFRHERIFQILEVERQVEDKLSVNVKKVVQCSDLNRYVLDFI